MDSQTSIYQDSDDLDKAFPWHCYSNGLKQFDQYASLQELCDANGLNIHDALDAIKHRNGNLGAFHIVRRY